MPFDLMTDRQMETLSRDNQCLQAITHTLTVIRDNPNVAWFLGVGSQTWALLTEAYATLTGQTMADVRRLFRPAASHPPQLSTDNEDEDQA